MEKYTFKHNEINNEFHDKLVKENYVIRKITIHLDKEVDRKYNYWIYYDYYTYIDYFSDSIEFFNNTISFTCNQIIQKTISNFRYHFSIKYNGEYIDYKLIEVDILKPEIYIWKETDNLFKSIKNSDLIIKSNYFKTFDELINYIMDVSNMNYELSKKYLIGYGGLYLYSYYKNNEKDEEENDEDEKIEFTLFNGSALYTDEDDE